MQGLRVDGVERIGSLAEALDGHPEAELDGHPEAEASYPLAMVEWHDAWFDLDQLTVDERRTDYLVRTVGFLIDDGPRVVSLAQELLPDGEGFRAVTHIPRAVVQRVVRLGTGA